MHKLIIIVLFLISLPAYAISPEAEQAAKQAVVEAQKLKPQVFQKVKDFNPKTAFDHYGENPKETKYYEEGKQDLSRINNDALNQMTDSENGKTVLGTINERPQYTIRPTDTDIKRSVMLQSDADNIVHGMTGRYIDCHAKQACEMRYIEKMCTASSIHEEMTCKKNLIIGAAQPQQAYQTITVRLQAIPTYYRNLVDVKFNMANGKVLSSIGKVAILTVNPTLPTSNCPSLDLQYLGMNNQSGYPVDVQVPTQPSCGNGLVTKVIITRKRTFNRPMDITLSYRIPMKQEPTIQESWSNNCGYLEQLKQQGICRQNNPDVCTSTDKTRVINGIEVTRQCWAMSSHYSCNVGESENTCRTTPLDNCEQINSTCEKMISGICVLSKQAYRCQQNACINTADVVCGDGSDYCLDGSCTDHSYKPSQDFGKAVLSLTATNEAVKSYDLNAIFKGRSLECRDDAGNFSNCCQESGWGQDMGLAHCSDEEKVLGDNREKELAVKVGRYCSSKVLGMCVEHKESFCVFNSKIAKVIQEQGRRGQLRIRFGDAKHPNCRGLSPQELQRIDLSRIDFGKAIYNDLAKRMKPVNANEMQQLIEQHVKQFQEMGQANG